MVSVSASLMVFKQTLQQFCPGSLLFLPPVFTESTPKRGVICQSRSRGNWPEAAETAITRNILRTPWFGGKFRPFLQSFCTKV